MKAVGIRELKNRLSEYVRLVRSGEEVLVTDRGEVVAELRPPGFPRLESAHPGLETLVRRGTARLGAPNNPSLYPRCQRALSHETSGVLLDEERAEQ